MGHYVPKTHPFLVLDKNLPEGVFIPKALMGKNIVHLPTVKTHVFTTNRGNEKCIWGITPPQPPLDMPISTKPLAMLDDPAGNPPGDLQSWMALLPEMVPHPGQCAGMRKHPAGFVRPGN